jgi:hypothetical protein
MFMPRLCLYLSAADPGKWLTGALVRALAATISAGTDGSAGR